MTAYIDTSVLLRLLLREPGGLESVGAFDRLVSSELLAVEGPRTIDRLRLQGALTTDEASTSLRAFQEAAETIDLVLVRAPVLSRASEPMPLPLGTLDAVHLATALAWRDRVGPLPVLLTHDAILGQAARTFGFDVKGI